MSEELNTTNKKYLPTTNALKFIGFVRATGNEEFSSPELHYKMADKLFSDDPVDKNVLEECCRGVGKALALSEVVYTEAGVKTVNEVNVGDRIYDHTGELTDVVRKSKIFYDDTYEVETHDGRVITACADHQWEVFTKSKNKDTSRKRHINSTKEIEKKPVVLSKNWLEEP